MKQAEPAHPVLSLVDLGATPFGTVLADPPWRFQNRTGKVAPEHRRLSRYDTMSVDEICALPVADLMADQSHCYLWVPNALLGDGLRVMDAWGFTYKSMLVWAKRRKDGRFSRASLSRTPRAERVAQCLRASADACERHSPPLQLGQGSGRSLFDPCQTHRSRPDGRALRG
jgi:hypothetical protein